MEHSSDARLASLPPADRIVALRQEIDRLAARLTALDPTRLDQPAIGDWTVREVVAHLGQVASFYTDSIVRGASGDPSAAGNRPPAGTGRGETQAPGIKEGAVAVAEAHPDVIAGFQTRAARLADTLGGPDGTGALDHPCYHPGGIVPANRFLVLYFKELGLHEWDIFEALDPPCPMSPWGTDADYLAMEEEIASGSLRWVTDPARSPETVTVRVTTTGPVTAERDLILDATGTRLAAVDSQRTIDGRLRLDSRDFVLACSGRLDLMAALADGRAEGDTGPASVLARRLTGM